MRRPRTGPTDTQRRPPSFRRGWLGLAGPLLLMTAIGGVAVLFLYSCARQSELELQLQRAQTGLAELSAQQQRLCAQIEIARDPAALRRFAQLNGMSQTPAGVDHIRLRVSLPPAQWAISAVARLTPVPAEGPLTPAGSLAARPVLSPAGDATEAAPAVRSPSRHG